MAIPETRYARNGDVRIAYQVVGDGPLDLIMVPGLASHLDLAWEDPEHAQFLEELALFSRLILFDKRGTGLSDRRVSAPGLEQRIADVLAVMAEAGSRRAAVFGFSEGGKMALALAAAHPERVRALALFGAFARGPTRSWPSHQIEPRFALTERVWGVPMLPPSVAPSMAADQVFRERWARFERLSASAAMAIALFRMDHELDVTETAERVRVPTLLLHRSGDQRIPVEHGRHLAEHMPAASYVELPGANHLPYIGDSERVVDEVRKFLVGVSNTA
jgi:pimeloyl-ACP methyl ester carboxylesterase